MPRSIFNRDGRVTIPKPVRKRLGLKPGDRLEFVVHDDGTALMVPATLRAADLAGCLKPPKRRASLADLERCIRGRISRRSWVI
ncbi:MAG TPA: AbrB/MazE/SpoVT family DNA-binding domain-containing protein [Rhodospirillales bacterium]